MSKSLPRCPRKEHKLREQSPPTKDASFDRSLASLDNPLQPPAGVRCGVISLEAYAPATERERSADGPPLNILRQ